MICYINFKNHITKLHLHIIVTDFNEKAEMWSATVLNVKKRKQKTRNITHVLCLLFEVDSFLRKKSQPPFDFIVIVVVVDFFKQYKTN